MRDDGCAVSICLCVWSHAQHQLSGRALSLLKRYVGEQEAIDRDAVLKEGVSWLRPLGNTAAERVGAEVRLLEWLPDRIDKPQLYCSADT